MVQKLDAIKIYEIAESGNTVRDLAISKEGPRVHVAVFPILNE